MKRYFILLLLAFSLLNCYAQEGFTLKVKLDNFKDYKPYLSYGVDGKRFMDTVYATENGWMVFKGKVKEPTYARLSLSGNPELFIRMAKHDYPGPALNFFLSNEEIKVTGNADKIYMASVEGGAVNKDWPETLRARQNELNGQSWEALKKAYHDFKPGGDSTALKKAKKLENDNRGGAQ
ncbi:hypothetical protein ABIE26_001564 [Pedobacter africanus]|uniref:Uncharacterized protein n=1 Tax=Pedobacter africanus TaxID=151894 RepID=A0ACC6KRU6_9SPHI|nr:DUF4369 domain-containing protein [Pedobacter africanus]MDR6781947.1 hypothetical protein [Pedobacter africanus]